MLDVFVVYMVDCTIRGRVSVEQSTHCNVKIHRDMWRDNHHAWPLNFQYFIVRFWFIHKGFLRQPSV